MDKKLKIVSFKWQKTKSGFVMPYDCPYGDKHVLIHKNMFERHLTIQHEYICITDKPIVGVKCLPLWDKCRELGGCFNRLYTFSYDMKEIIGERFACVDLDVVITGNVDNIFGCKDDFRINSYKSVNPQNDPDQYYNGGLYIMNAGARAEVWGKFKYDQSPALCEAGYKKKQCIGSDQAWIRLTLGKKEKRFTEMDGVYEYRQVQNKGLPENASMVFFAGNRDPSTCPDRWVKEHWK